jgi:hypothetical protein
MKSERELAEEMKLALEGACIEAGIAARHASRSTGTPLIICVDGVVVKIPASELPPEPMLPPARIPGYPGT